MNKLQKALDKTDIILKKRLSLDETIMYDIIKKRLEEMIKEEACKPVTVLPKEYEK